MSGSVTTMPSGSSAIRAANASVLMPRLPLAPVLARASLRSSLAVVFADSCLDSRSLRSSLVPRCDPHSRSSSGTHTWMLRACVAMPVREEQAEQLLAAGYPGLGHGLVDVTLDG